MTNRNDFAIFICNLKSKCIDSLNLDYYYKELPFLMTFGSSDPIESILELIKYQHKLLLLSSNDRFNLIRRNGNYDQLINYLTNPFSSFEDICEFSLIKEQFYKFYSFSSIDNILLKNLELLVKKVTSLEQFQANILDKISVFAEIIDNKLEK